MAAGGGARAARLQQRRVVGDAANVALLTRAQVPEQQRQGDVRQHLLSADARRALAAAERLRARLQLLGVARVVCVLSASIIRCGYRPSAARHPAADQRAAWAVPTHGSTPRVSSAARLLTARRSLQKRQGSQGEALGLMKPETETAGRACAVPRTRAFFLSSHARNFLTRSPSHRHRPV